MRFNLYVNVTESDYLDFNVFWFLRSPYGKKQKNKMNLMLILLSIGFALLSFVTNYKHYASLATAAVSSVIMLALMLSAVLIYPRFYKKTLQRSLQSQKKAGKLSYTPVAQLEFYDEYYVETAPDSTTKQNYTAFERISYIPGQAIYIHTGAAKAVLVPVSCFASQEELQAFLQFIAGKCPRFDTYQK